MNYGKITQAYQNAENQALQETEDPHLIVLTMLNALLKSMGIFVQNIDISDGGELELKSKHFARSLTIIYALQTSLDFAICTPRLLEHASSNMIGHEVSHSGVKRSAYAYTPHV